MKLQFYILTWDGTSVWRRSYIHHTRIFDPGEPSPYAAGDHTIKINVKIKHPPPPPVPRRYFLLLIILKSESPISNVEMNCFATKKIYFYKQQDIL